MVVAAAQRLRFLLSSASLINENTYAHIDYLIRYLCVPIVHAFVIDLWALRAV